MKDYYENNRERLRYQAKDKYRNLSEEDKNIKREYGKNRYQNMSEKSNKNLKNIKKVIKRQKSLHIMINEIVF